jgi:hypothetical protein
LHALISSFWSLSASLLIEPLEMLSNESVDAGAWLIPLSFSISKAVFLFSKL